MFLLRVSRRKCRCYSITYVLMLMFFLKISLTWIRWPDLSKILEVEKCPACYGINLCPDFMANKINMRGHNLYTHISNMITTKNVFYSDHSRFGKVVVKRLGHDWELEVLDEKVCELLKLNMECKIYSELANVAGMRNEISNVLKYHPNEMDFGRAGMILCPGTNGVDEFLEVFFKDEYNLTQDKSRMMGNFWTILNINAEPIILKYLNKDGNWPVPKYLGACGRSTVQTYAGPMLSSYLSEPWLSRANFSLKLLDAAEMFTFRHKRFRFYLTDLSSDNIAVSNVSLVGSEAIFIDLENIIVVDQMSDEITPLWNWNHTSEVIECPGCFAFSANMICGHHLSDHNYYSMCKLLKDEVLEGVPKFVLLISPDFPRFLDECISPPKSNPNRFIAAKKLYNEIVKILRSFNY